MDIEEFSLCCALRGPDFASEELVVLREELTRRVRHIAGIESESLACQVPFDEDALARVRKALEDTKHRVFTLLAEQPVLGNAVAKAIANYLDSTSDGVALTALHEVWNGYSAKLIEAILDCSTTILAAAHGEPL
jgi:hypothetical protein